MSGITANLDQLKDNVSRSIGIVTALNPFIGYANATDIAREALATGTSVLEIVVERGLLTRQQLERLLQPEALTRPGLPLLAEEAG